MTNIEVPTIHHDELRPYLSTLMVGDECWLKRESTNPASPVRCKLGFATVVLINAVGIIVRTTNDEFINLDPLIGRIVDGEYIFTLYPYNAADKERIAAFQKALGDPSKPNPGPALRNENQAQKYRRDKAQTITDALISAMEQTEGAEHVVIVFDKGDMCRIITDKDSTVAQVNYSLDIAKMWLLKEADDE